jgi:cation diffusion facilitator CzcD-associated flavoprotein CzcO
MIQPHVAHLSVFQRTPAWVLPHTDRRITETERRLYRRFPAAQRLVRNSIYAAREMLVFGLAKDQRYIKPLRRVATVHMHKQVKDRELRKKLTPRYSPGCKRLLLSDNFYPTLTKPNVELVTDQISEVSKVGIVTRDGHEHRFDTLIFATGFRVTDNPVLQRIHGRDGRSLSETWSSTGMQAYLGTTVAGFPNFFMMTGPNTGIGHTSLLVMIESQIRYVLDALRFMDRRRVSQLEVRPEVVTSFNEELQRKMSRTVWNAGGCASWYLDEHGRNTTLWPDFTWKFRARTRRFDPESYDTVPGFAPSRLIEEATSA